MLIDPWRNFTSIMAYDFTEIKDVVSDVDIDLPSDIYSLSGVRVADSTDGLAPGIYIVSLGNVWKKIAVNYK